MNRGCDLEVAILRVALDVTAEKGGKGAMDGCKLLRGEAQ